MVTVVSQFVHHLDRNLGFFNKKNALQNCRKFDYNITVLRVEYLCVFIKIDANLESLFSALFNHVF